jgi:cyanate lyase
MDFYWVNKINDLINILVIKITGKQTPIKPTVDRLYPTVSLYGNLHGKTSAVEGNFGDNLVAKPFEYDIRKCPGLVFE